MMRKDCWTLRKMKNVHVPATLLMLVSLYRPSASCPSICSCNITHSDCSGIDLSLVLHSVLTQLPSNLTSLTLSSNNLTLIYPGAFTNLSSLLQLNISKNHLLTLHPSTFSQMSSLEVLDLSSNFLENLPADLFSDLISLRELVLRDNKFNALNPKLFYNLAELQHLDLSNNSLTSLPSGILDGLQNLAWLSLAGNQLRIIQRSALEPLSVLQRLLLEGNHWNCNCSLMPFRHWLEWMLYRGGHADSITCSLPSTLRGRDLRRVPMEMFRHCSQFTLPDTKNHPAACFRTADGHLVSTDPTSDCLRHRHRPVSVRRAPVTVVVAGVVCSVVCVMMVVAAAYGCIYATLAAHQQQELLERSLQLQQQPLIEEKEPGPENRAPDSDKETKAHERMEWMAFPPEVCV